ncbi:MAG: molybdopterin-dependent oxidoreductase [Terriglobia bacterium]
MLERADVELLPLMTRSDRRRFLRILGGGAAAGVGRILSRGLLAAEDPALAGRPLVRYPEKTDLILLTSRPPQLETPWHYFQSAITPNDAFYVRYHLSDIPTRVDLSTWRLRVGGHVERPLELSFDDLKNKFPPARVVAVNQCSGNSRGRFEPRVFGGQWGDGAMGNAEWVGVRLLDILKEAGMKAGAVDVTFSGLDEPPTPTVQDFAKSLKVVNLLDNPYIIVAYEMNGAPLPMLNGFPARLVVPGWYATYWVKHLSEITVLDREFDGFWIKTAYRIPDTPCGCVEPGAKPARTVPISRMNVRSFIVTPENGARVAAGRGMTLKGIAFDGGYGVAQVEVSSDGGATWRRAELGKDLGRFSFREWTASWTPARPGKYRLLVRATNRVGESQPFEPLWNPAGYLRNVIERTEVTAQ